MVHTAAERGWSALENGDLLARASERGYEVLITTDQGIPEEQAGKHKELAVVVLKNSNWNVVREYAPAILDAIERTPPGQCSAVDIPYHRGGLEPG